jgi:acetyl-CoA carboxylase carboxyl transferase subunit alpha
MVETHWSQRNGDAREMDVRLKAEQELARIEQQIEHLQAVPGQSDEIRREVEQLHERVEALRRQIHSGLTAWEKTELARHPQRPYTLDYVERIFTDWSEIHGDRDLPMIRRSCAAWRGFTGKRWSSSDSRRRAMRNRGSIAISVCHTRRATAGAARDAHRREIRPSGVYVRGYGRSPPGLGAEERGQGEAIAYNLREMARLESADHCDCDWRGWKRVGRWPSRSRTGCS